MKAKSKFSVDVFIKYFLAIFMFVITILTFYQVVMRYIFSNAPFWSEEVVRFMFVWVTMIAAAIGIKEGIHIGVDAIVNLFPPTLRRISNIFVYLVILAFSFVLIIYGWKVVAGTANQPSPAIGLPMSYVYLAMPAGGLLMIYYSVSLIIKNLKEGK